MTKNSLQTSDHDLPKKAAKIASQATDKQVADAIKQASRFIDNLPFRGQKITETQKLAWPRIGVTGKDGKPVMGVPNEIKKAIHMIASFIVAKVPLDQHSMGWVMRLIGHLVHYDSAQPDAQKSAGKLQ